MTKRKTLIAFLCIVVGGLSQDNDEWSQDYNDYEGHFDEIFKVPVDDEYDDLIKKLKETRENDFEPGANDKDLVDFGDNQKSIDPEFDYDFYDSLVNDNGEIYNDGPQELYSSEANKEEQTKLHYGLNANEDTVKDENINGNAAVNDYDPDEFYEDGNVDQRLAKNILKQDAGNSIKSNESKLVYLNNNQEDEYNININVEPGKNDISQSQNKCEDKDFYNNTNEVGHIENAYDDINENKNKLIEMMGKINYDEELDSIDDDGKSSEDLNDVDIYENKHPGADNIGINDRDQENQNSDAEIVVDNDIINDTFRGNYEIIPDKKYTDNLKFNNQIHNNHEIATNFARNQSKDSDDIVADSSIDKMDIDQSILHEDTEEVYVDEKISVEVGSLEKSEEKQSGRAKSNDESDKDSNEYAHDQFGSDNKFADKINENNLDDTKGESKLSIEDLNREIENFIVEHNGEILYNLKTLDVSPKNVKLSYDKAVTISSPNYPEPYTGNNVMDWYFDGEGGTGVELNITDFSVDGSSGDYLLIKPGQTDTSGSNGIIFTYTLNQERRYRFMDVENMFVRFESKGSNIQNFKGFEFSVKFIEPKADRIVETDPEPEPVVVAPEQTHTVHLTGLTLHETDKMESFRDVLTSMAAVYIEAKWPQCLQPTLSEAVHLTRLTTCNVAWPHTGGCITTTFAIPLPCDDGCDGYRLTTEQMKEMWTTYSHVEPFATRMSILGISEYESPNDRAILMVWWAWTFGAVLVVCAIVLSVRHLGCLHDYNGMSRLHEESDSVNSGRKSDLSLYPTPHQTLPPMFADGKFDHYLDGDYVQENTTRVDLCGALNNKGFVRDGELMNLDSDEEIIMSLPDEAKPNTRPSYSSGIKPHDVYEV